MRAGNGDGSIRKRVTKTKGTVWDVQLTVRLRNGMGKRITKRGFATRKEATAWRDAEQRRVRAMNSLGAKPMSVPELVERYIKEGPLAGATPGNYAKVLRLYVKPMLNVRADALTVPRLQKFADTMTADLNSRGFNGASTVNMAVAAVRGAYRWATSDGVGLLDFNPVGGSTIALPQRQEGVRRSLGSGTYQDLLAAAAEERRYVWRLLFESAARDGEVLALRWKDVDLDTGRVSITRIRTPESNYTQERERTKSGRNRTAYLSPALCADLRALREERGAKPSDHILITQRGRKRLSMSQLQKWWDIDRKAAGLDGRTIHELRHTWATEALGAGVDVRVVQEVLGHASLDTTMRYTHTSEEGKRMASNAVQQVVSPRVDAAKTAAVHNRTKKIA